MKTFLFIVVLLFGSGFVWKVSLTVLNLAGLPGALVTGISNKRQSVGGILRFGFGAIISALGQSYGYLAFVAVVVILVRHWVHDEGGFGYVLWPVGFIAAFMPVYLCAAAGIGEAEMGYSEWNAQVVAITLTEILAVIAFFIFPFVPNVVLLGWLWISYLSQYLVGQPA
jgi:hypothetical protein